MEYMNSGVSCNLSIRLTVTLSVMIGMITGKDEYRLYQGMDTCAPRLVRVIDKCMIVSPIT